MNSLPELKTENGVTALYVGGKPFLSLGGELHNSSASSPAYMRDKVWPNLRGLNLNSVVATVSWEQIERVENQFDFTAVDRLISGAKQENIRLILIWFGLWKNGASSYIPGWMKRNPEQYWKCVPAASGDRRMGSMGLQTVSPLCTRAVEADAKAYRSLMRHIREYDKDYTVIMMQVENEIGLLGSARDFSPEANRQFETAIPPELSEAYQVRGSWKQAFGDDAEEYFMAWHYGKAVERIASAGAEEHPLPMYVNAWLQQYPDRAGYYPSGGPVAKLMKLWRLAAPSICMYAPDIYVPDFEKAAREYTQDGNPLFIPETRNNVVSAASVFLAFGKYNAIGFHPFGIEDVLGQPEHTLDLAELAALNIDPSAFSMEGSAKYLPMSYSLILNMSGIINKYRGTGHMSGFYQYGTDNGCILSFSKYDLHISYYGVKPGTPPGGGLVIETSEDEFILAGVNFKAAFLPKKGEEKYVDFIQIREGGFVNDEWLPGRILNGDEQRLAVRDIPKTLRVELYTR